MTRTDNKGGKRPLVPVGKRQAPPLLPGCVFLLACVLFNLWAVRIGWGHSLLDQHGFRQTQTAISVWRLLEGGPWLAYETPVLGPPWAIPMEFPLYQWVVTVAVRVLGLPLDQAGRVVSLAFFYLSMPAAFLLLRRLRVAPSHALALLGLWLVSPQYLFWSRTFMIETAALCFGLWYLVGTMRLVDEPGLGRGLVVAACGSLAGLVKLTTVVPVMLLAAVWCAATWWRVRPSRIQVAGTATALFLVPVLITAVWTEYAESVRAANPLARSFLLAAQLNTWNFGTQAQRISGEFWRVLVLRTVPDAVGHLAVMGGAGLLVAWVPLRWKETLACVGAFLVAPLTFTNLHVVHNYYACANAVFLVAAVGLAVVVVLEAPGRRRYVGIASLVVVGAIEVSGFLGGYYVTQLRETQPVAAATVARLTEPDDVVLVYGGDWSSVLPYYARRRALMDRSNRSFADPVMQEALAALHGDRIGAAVFCGATRVRTDLTRQAQLTFALENAPLRVSGCDVYARAASAVTSGAAVRR